MKFQKGDVAYCTCDGLIYRVTGSAVRKGGGLMYPVEMVLDMFNSKVVNNAFINTSVLQRATRAHLWQSISHLNFSIGLLERRRTYLEKLHHDLGEKYLEKARRGDEFLETFRKKELRSATKRVTMESRKKGRG